MTDRLFAPPENVAFRAKLGFSVFGFGAVAIAAGIVAFAAASSAAGGVPITPPPGWQLYKSGVGVLIWRQPGSASFHQNIVVTRQPTPLTAAAYDSDQVQALLKAVPGFKLGSFQDGSVCSGQPAHYFSYAGVSDGRPFIAEHITLVRGAFAWSAQYTRLASQPQLAAARRSLTTLCGSDLAPAAAMRATAVPTAYRGASPSPSPEYLPTQVPPGRVEPTVTPRVGP